MERAGEVVAEEARVVRVGPGDVVVVDHHIGCSATEQRELGRRIGDRRRVEPDVVDVVEEDVDVTARVQVVPLDVLAGKRRLQVDGRSAQSTGRRRGRDRLAEDREAVHAEALELETETAAERELRSTLQRERLRQAA